MGFSQSSFLSQIACIVSIVGVFCLLIGVFTVAWITFESSFIDYGLFQICQDGVCETFPALNGSEYAWFEATRGLVVISVILGFICMAVLVYWVFVANDKKRLQNISFVLAFASGLTALVGVSVFGGMWESTFQFTDAKLGWSFALTAASGITFVLVGGLLVLDKLKR